MYSALVVDDEKMIRDGIKAIIPWAKIGIGAVYLAADGAGAIAAVEKNKPDILLTDIHMTGMTGLKLIEHIRAANADMRVLVLTGYDSFDYAQQCLKMQVQDFILKPVDEDVLTQSLRRQVEALNQAGAVQRMARIINVQEQIRLEQAMRDAVGGRGSKNAAALLADYDYREGMQLQLALVSTFPGEHDDNGAYLALSIKNLCIDMFDSRKQGVTFEDEDGHIAIAVFTDSWFDEAVERLERLGQLAEAEFGSGVRTVLGSKVIGISALAESYGDACAMMRESAGASGEVHQHGHGERRLKMFNAAFAEFKRAISGNLGDYENMARVYAAFENAVDAYDLSDSYVRRCCFDLASALFFTYVEEADNSVDNSLNTLLTALKGAARKEVLSLTGAYIKKTAGGEHGATHELVTTAIQYIRDHLSENLSLYSLAQLLYVNPNYLSRLFKKSAGEGCNEYIVRKRVEKAKSLLETTDIRTGKIAAMVGYRDANYFSLAFKKYTGVSPTAYREGTRDQQI